MQFLLILRLSWKNMVFFQKMNQFLIVNATWFMFDTFKWCLDPCYVKLLSVKLKYCLQHGVYFCGRQRDFFWWCWCTFLRILMFFSLILCFGFLGTLSLLFLLVLFEPFLKKMDFGLKFLDFISESLYLVFVQRLSLYFLFVL